MGLCHKWVSVASIDNTGLHLVKYILLISKINSLKVVSVLWYSILKLAVYRLSVIT